MIYTFKEADTRWLSNFTPVEIQLNGFKYQSVEHAYMSAKFDNPEWKEYCRIESRASKIKQASYERLSYDVLIDNWEHKRLHVMTYCVLQKFMQEPFKTKLIETGSQNIQEGNYHNDKFWGIDLKDSPNIGENHLGRIIMWVRNVIQKDEEKITIFLNKLAKKI